jgi:DNA-binding NarL/FixJ family response regulator
MHVLVAESDANLRAALCVWVGHIENAELAGVARSGRELLQALRISSADLALIDWSLLAGQAVQVFAEARLLTPAPRMIVLSAQPEVAQEALALGADALIDTRRLPAALLEVLRTLNSSAAPG